MHGSASKTKAPYPARVSFGRHGCPVLSHLAAAGGTEKRCANWAFVSGVSPVSANLKLIERIQKKKVGNGRKGISGGYASCAETGGTDGTRLRGAPRSPDARQSNSGCDPQIKEKLRCVTE
jgi:hypothetical protein